MATFTGPNVSLDGMILCLDAGNTKSYPGTGNTWFDISADQKFNATLVSSPSFNTNRIITNGTNNYIQVSDIPTSTERTVNIVYNLTGSSGGPLWRVNDWRERIFNGSTNLIASSGTYYSLSAPGGNQLVNYCYSYGGTNAKSYINGVLVQSITMNSSMNIGTYSYRFGNQSSGSSNYYVAAEYYYISFYDRQLTDDEVKYNYNALRNRYGI